MAKLVLTPELQTQIERLVNAGASIRAACESTSVSWNTAKDWLAKGAKPGAKPVYREFREAMERAKAAWKAGTELRIVKASHDDWKAGAWLLERREPEEYSLKTKHEVTGKDGATLLPEGEKRSVVELVAGMYGYTLQRPGDGAGEDDGGKKEEG